VSQEAIALSEGQRAALRRARGCLLSVMAQLMAQRREVRVPNPRNLPSAMFVPLLRMQPAATLSGCASRRRQCCRCSPDCSVRCTQWLVFSQPRACG
jgi:hypothetical protein